jgi:hypothetical protein
MHPLAHSRHRCDSYVLQPMPCVRPSRGEPEATGREVGLACRIASARRCRRTDARKTALLSLSITLCPGFGVKATGPNRKRAPVAQRGPRPIPHGWTSGGRASSREELPKSHPADDRGQHRHRDAQGPLTQARGFTTPEPAEREPVRQTGEDGLDDPGAREPFPDSLGVSMHSDRRSFSAARVPTAVAPGWLPRSNPMAESRIWSTTRRGRRDFGAESERLKTKHHSFCLLTRLTRRSPGFGPGVPSASLVGHGAASSGPSESHQHGGGIAEGQDETGARAGDI